MKILIFSLGEKGYRVVKALSEKKDKHAYVCVIGHDGAVEKDFSSDLTDFCIRNKIEYYIRKRFTYDISGYDLVLAVGWRWLIRGVSEEKLIVFHDSLLPRYRGFAPLVTALINKEKETGVTALFGGKNYDTGNIVLQKKMSITYPTTIAAEINRISTVYSDLAVELVEKYSENNNIIASYEQDESKSSYSLWRDEEDYRINWDSDAKDIEHFISCVGYPYRGATSLLDGKKIRIIKAKARADVTIENRNPGKVIFLESGLPVVVCGSGLITLIDICGEYGESLMPIKSFRSRFG
ncbi:methionyl-tRNA formyltransferase [Billgrantia montanilacus]|uniref:Methionyl-tRNA formyltransferase n=1 Tax=Billgrantia montanilacus TaxID=2282305 RepID=A0A368U3M1_9GAMM|nr:formyltransferase family protein [Halomonas montanilacus]RCV91604.1 methionyl-tRNA formyltransferase [Halomonas montanilacus]